MSKKSKGKRKITINGGDAPPVTPVILRLPKVVFPTDKEAARLERALIDVTKALESFEKHMKPFIKFENELDEAECYNQDVGSRLTNDQWDEMYAHMKTLNKKADVIRNRTDKATEKFFNRVEKLRDSL